MDVVRLMKDQTGVSAFSTHAGFNVCGYAGADSGTVGADLMRLSEFTGIDVSEIYLPRQTHSVRVGLPCDNLEGVDALVTDCPGRLLCISTADCLPLLLYDPEARVIGAAHCGWRGTVGGIALATVEAMERLGASREHIVAATGPYICPECFEVGEEVAELFPPEAVVRRAGRPRPYVDLLRAVRCQLDGVRFSDSAGCSMENPLFYSVRRQGRELPYRTLTAISMNLL